MNKFEEKISNFKLLKLNKNKMKISEFKQKYKFNRRISEAKSISDGNADEFIDIKEIDEFELLQSKSASNEFIYYKPKIRAKGFEKGFLKDLFKRDNIPILEKLQSQLHKIISFGFYFLVFASSLIISCVFVNYLIIFFMYTCSLVFILL